MKTYTHDHNGLNELMKDHGLPERFDNGVCWPDIAKQRPEVIDVIRRQVAATDDGFRCAFEIGDPEGLLYRRCAEVGTGRACRMFAYYIGDPEGILYRRCAEVGDGYDCRWFARRFGDPEGLLAARIKQLEESQ